MSDQADRSELPQGWERKTFDEVLKPIAVQTKIKTKEYQSEGPLPVVDQGDGLINGYWDDESAAVQADPPLIAFGDHTRRLKFCDFRFAQGADGLKVLKVDIDANPKWVFWALRAAELPNRGYGRHFQYLKRAVIPLPPRELQEDLVKQIEVRVGAVDEAVEHCRVAHKRLTRFRTAISRAAVDGAVSPRPLEELVEILDSRRIPLNAKERAAKSGTVPYYGATGLVDHVDEPLFDEELVLLGEDGVQFFDPHAQKAYIIRGKSWVNNHAHVLRAKREIVLAEYLRLALNVASYEGLANGTTRLKLTQAAMKRMVLPVPSSLEVQERIVQQASEGEESADRLEVAIDEAETQSERLSRAVLLNIVSGGDVTHVPSEELPKKANPS